MDQLELLRHEVSALRALVMNSVDTLNSDVSQWLKLMQQLYPISSLQDNLNQHALETMINIMLHDESYADTKYQVLGLGFLAMPKMIYNNNYPSQMINIGTYICNTLPNITMVENEYSGYSCSLNYDDTDDVWLFSINKTASSSSKANSNKLTKNKKFELVIEGFEGKVSNYKSKYLQALNKTKVKPRSTLKAQTNTLAKFRNLSLPFGGIIKTTCLKFVLMVLNYDKTSITLNFIKYTILHEQLNFEVCETVTIAYDYTLLVTLLNMFTVTYCPLTKGSLNINSKKFKSIFRNIILNEIKDNTYSISKQIIQQQAHISANELSGYNALFEISNLSKIVAKLTPISCNMTISQQFPLTKITSQTGFLSDNVITGPSYGSTCSALGFNIIRCSEDNLISEFAVDNMPIQYSFTDHSYGANSSDVYTVDAGSAKVRVIPATLNVSGGDPIQTDLLITVSTEILSTTYKRLGVLTNDLVFTPISTYNFMYDSNSTYNAAINSPMSGHVLALITSGVMSMKKGYLSHELLAKLQLKFELRFKAGSILQLPNDANCVVNLTVGKDSKAAPTNYTIPLVVKQYIEDGKNVNYIYGNLTIAMTDEETLYSMGDTFDLNIGPQMLPVFIWSNGHSYQMGSANGIKAYKSGGSYTSSLCYATSQKTDASQLFQIDDLNLICYHPSNFYGGLAPSTEAYHKPSKLVLDDHDGFNFQGPSFAPDSIYPSQNFNGVLSKFTALYDKPETKPETAVVCEYRDYTMYQFVKNLRFDSAPVIVFDINGQFVSKSSFTQTITLNNFSLDIKPLLAPNNYNPTYDISDAFKNLQNNVTVLINSNAAIKVRLNSIDDRVAALQDAFTALNLRVTSLINNLIEQNFSNGWFENFVGLFSDISTTLFPEFAPLIMTAAGLIDGIYNMSHGDYTDGAMDMMLATFCLAKHTLTIDKSFATKISGTATSIPNISDTLSDRVINARGKSYTSDVLNVYNVHDTAIEMEAFAQLTGYLAPKNKIITGFNDLVFTPTAAISSDKIRLAMLTTDLTYNLTYTNHIYVSMCSSFASFAYISFPVTCKPPMYNCALDASTIEFKCSKVVNNVRQFTNVTYLDLLTDELDDAAQGSVVTAEFWVYALNDYHAMKNPNINRYNNMSLSTVDCMVLSLPISITLKKLWKNKHIVGSNKKIKTKTLSDYGVRQLSNIFCIDLLTCVRYGVVVDDNLLTITDDLFDLALNNTKINFSKFFNTES
ncbi:137.1 kDa protein [Psammotettix alienus reovirus]|nr:137.1 kDa protein [Psammotettix alienus reovirus]